MLLLLHSKSNWNTYCLSYLLTDRDYSGVLGIAFNGQTGKKQPHALKTKGGHTLVVTITMISHHLVLLFKVLPVPFLNVSCCLGIAFLSLCRVWTT